MSIITGAISAITGGFQDYFALSYKKHLYAQEATQAEREAAADAARIARQGQVVQAKQQAAAGAAGVSESPSALSVIIDSALQNAQDVAMTKYRGAVSAWGLREGEQAAGRARGWASLIAGGQTAGYAMQAYDKYVYQQDQKLTAQRNYYNSPEASQKMWFGNMNDPSYESSGVNTSGVNWNTASSGFTGTEGV